jgi:hypothetical protein
MRRQRSDALCRYSSASTLCRCFIASAGLLEQTMLYLERELVAQVAADLNGAMEGVRPNSLAMPPSVFAQARTGRVQPLSNVGL